MALDRAIRCGNDNGASVYDSRGIFSYEEKQWILSDGLSGDYGKPLTMAMSIFSTDGSEGGKLPGTQRPAAAPTASSSAARPPARL
jgi:hypothetical protein